MVQRGIPSIFFIHFITVFFINNTLSTIVFINRLIATKIPYMRHWYFITNLNSVVINSLLKTLIKFIPGVPVQVIMGQIIIQ